MVLINEFGRFLQKRRSAISKQIRPCHEPAVDNMLAMTHSMKVLHINLLNMYFKIRTKMLNMYFASVL